MAVPRGFLKHRFGLRAQCEKWTGLIGYFRAARCVPPHRSAGKNRIYANREEGSFAAGFPAGGTLARSRVLRKSRKLDGTDVGMYQCGSEDLRGKDGYRTGQGTEGPENRMDRVANRHLRRAARDALKPVFKFPPGAIIR